MRFVGSDWQYSIIYVSCKYKVRNRLWGVFSERVIWGVSSERVMWGDWGIFRDWGIWGGWGLGMRNLRWQCDQCAKWNQTWIFHFYVQCTYSDQIVVMRVEKFLSSQKLEGTMNRKAEKKFIDIWMWLVQHGWIHSIDLLFKLLIKEDIHQGWKHLMFLTMLMRNKPKWFWQGVKWTYHRLPSSFVRTVCMEIPVVSEVSVKD